MYTINSRWAICLSCGLTHKIRNSFRTSGAGQLASNGKTSFLIGLLVPISWLATEKPVFLSDFWCRSVGGQQKNQSLKEGVICYGRRTFLSNLSSLNVYNISCFLIKQKAPVPRCSDYFICNYSFVA